MSKSRKRNKLNVIAVFLFIGICYSCGNDPTPKPRAYLSLEYPKAKYVETEIGVPFTFQKNELAEKVSIKNFNTSQKTYGVNLEYPNLKGTIYLTYKAIKSRDNLIEYLRDAQNFTQEHTKRADEIVEQPYSNKERNVYGMFYEIGGNAASQSQFYVTDSTNHFLIGSLYFYTKPNFDSILPAAHYLMQDIKKIMETVEWKSAD
jgi:gliding motility-associated lipoprotein GldD